MQSYTSRANPGKGEVLPGPFGGHHADRSTTERVTHQEHRPPSLELLLQRRRQTQPDCPAGRPVTSFSVPAASRRRSAPPGP